MVQCPAKSFAPDLIRSGTRLYKTGHTNLIRSGTRSPKEVVPVLTRSGKFFPARHNGKIWQDLEFRLVRNHKLNPARTYQFNLTRTVC